MERSTPTPKRIGRPKGSGLTYTPEVRVEIIRTICAEIARGRPLAKIADDEGMPGLRTVQTWLHEDADFAARYARAREQQAEVVDSEIQAVIDDVRSGALESDAGRVVLGGLQWRAARLMPQRYGDRAQVDYRVQHQHEHTVDAGIVAAFLSQYNLPAPAIESVAAPVQQPALPVLTTGRHRAGIEFEGKDVSRAFELGELPPLEKPL